MKFLFRQHFDSEISDHVTESDAHRFEPVVIAFRSQRQSPRRGDDQDRDNLFYRLAVDQVRQRREQGLVGVEGGFGEVYF
jgi:hypothetical protein